MEFNTILPTRSFESKKKEWSITAETNTYFLPLEKIIKISQNKYAIHILIPIFSLKQLEAISRHIYFFCSRFILVIT